jgi:hypothetical protein
MLAFLDFIQPSVGYCEIRSIRSGRVTQAWFDDRGEAEAYALRLDAEGEDVYYGVLPRMSRDGSAKAVIAVQDVLWADIDAKGQFEGANPKDAALQAILNFEIPPAVIVDSGHGYHAYWKLVFPVAWDQAHPILVGLAQQLKGDHVYDQPRILRVPGTTNHKDPANPIPVRVLRFDTTRQMRPSDFNLSRDIGHRKLNPPRKPPAVYVPPPQRGAMPDWLQHLISEGAPQGQRSEQAFKVMCNLIERGWSDSEIRHAFDTGGIGEKMREQHDGGDRWFQRSLERAHERA